MVGLHYFKIVLTLKLVCVCSHDNIKICGINSNRYLQHLLTYVWNYFQQENKQGIQIRLVVFKPVSWYSNPSRGIQIRLVVFKSVSWYSNPSRGVQIRLRGFQIRLARKVNSLRLSCG